MINKKYNSEKQQNDFKCINFILFKFLSQRKWNKCFFAVFCAVPFNVHFRKLPSHVFVLHYFSYVAWSMARRICGGRPRASGGERIPQMGQSWKFSVRMTNGNDKQSFWFKTFSPFAVPWPTAAVTEFVTIPMSLCGCESIPKQRLSEKRSRHNQRRNEISQIILIIIQNMY